MLDPPVSDSFDLVCLFGLLNFKFSEFDNFDYAKCMVATAFEFCEKAVVVDMLTTVTDKTYPAEDFVFYYDPAEMLRFALELTPHVQVRHDYHSIPQRELMLVLRKSPCK